METQKIKCVIWDLDNTIWKGILSEDDEVILRPEMLNIIKLLDERGILQSISSKNDHDLAQKKLKDLNIYDYFLYPQINWGPKSESVEKIAKLLNIGKDTFAFIDDQQFEREEVNHAHQEVCCIDAADISEKIHEAEFIPNFITSDAKKRRILYQNDMKRDLIEESYEGTKEEFLATLDMSFTISQAVESDLQRMEELTVRTHQLNSTGYVYSYDELKEYADCKDHDLLVAQLDDKYGEYGKIGLALIEKKENVWYLRLLLMSCRVMSRGVGSVFLNYISNKAREKGVKLRSEFIPTDRNRMMLITFKFNHFREIEQDEQKLLLEADLMEEKQIPSYVNLIIKNSKGA